MIILNKENRRQVEMELDMMKGEKHRWLYPDNPTNARECPYP